MSNSHFPRHRLATLEMDVITVSGWITIAISLIKLDTKRALIFAT